MASQVGMLCGPGEQQEHTGLRRAGYKMHSGPDRQVAESCQTWLRQGYRPQLQEGLFKACVKGFELIRYFSGQEHCQRARARRFSRCCGPISQ